MNQELIEFRKVKLLSYRNMNEIWEQIKEGLRRQEEHWRMLERMLQQNKVELHMQQTCKVSIGARYLHERKKKNTKVLKVHSAHVEGETFYSTEMCDEGWRIYNKMEGTHLVIKD